MSELVTIVKIVNKLLTNPKHPIATIIGFVSTVTSESVKPIKVDTFSSVLKVKPIKDTFSSVSKAFLVNTFCEETWVSLRWNVLAPIEYR